MNIKDIILYAIVIISLSSFLYILIVDVPDHYLSKEEELAGMMMKPYNYTDRNIDESFGVPHGQIGFFKTIVCPATNKSEDSVIYGDTLGQKDPNERINSTGDKKVPRLNTVTFFYCTEHHVLFSYP